MAEVTGNEGTQEAQQGKARKRVYLNFHENYVRTVGYEDRETGEPRTFNVVTLPKGTVIDGVDYGGWEFSPLFVEPSRYRGENWRDIPLLADRKVNLHLDERDEDGIPLIDDEGKRVRQTVEVDPQQIKDALVERRRALAEARSKESQSLAEKAKDARDASETIGGSGGDPNGRSDR